MVWYFIGVYIINRTLHGRLEIRNFSSRVENISLVRCTHSWNIFQHSKRNFVSPRSHVISSICSIFDRRGTPLLPLPLKNSPYLTYILIRILAKMASLYVIFVYHLNRLLKMINDLLNFSTLSCTSIYEIFTTLWYTEN